MEQDIKMLEGAYERGAGDGAGWRLLLVGLELREKTLNAGLQSQSALVMVTLKSLTVEVTVGASARLAPFSRTLGGRQAEKGNFRICSLSSRVVSEGAGAIA